MVTESGEPVPRALHDVLQQWWPANLQKGNYFHLLQRQLEGAAVTVAYQDVKSTLISLPTLCGTAVAGHVPGAALPMLNCAWYCFYRAGNILDDAADGDLQSAAWGRSEQTAVGIAVNGAAGLMASANMLLGMIPHADGMNTQKVLVLQQRYQQAVLEMGMGQHRDLSDATPDLETCWTWTQQKSGPCFAVACWSGAYLANDRPYLHELFWEFGYHLGVLLQLKDDLVDLWERNGRCSDIGSTHSWTLPVAYTMHVLEPAGGAALAANLQAAAHDPTAAQEARQTIIESGAALFLMTKAKVNILKLRRILASLAQEEVVICELQKLVDALDSFT